MAGDVWRWCQVHQKWLQDVNVKVTPRGLQNDRSDSIFAASSSSYCSKRPERMGRVPAAVSTRWQDDGRVMDPVPPVVHFKSNKGGAPLQESGVALSRDLALETAAACSPEGAADVGSGWRRLHRPVKWLFQEPDPCNQNIVHDSNGIEGQTWVTVFSFNPDRDGTGGETPSLSSSEIDQVLREFAKCGTITQRIIEPNGANWVQIQYQSPREAGQALLKSGLRLEGGQEVMVRSLDESQRKELLLEKCGSNELSASMPLSFGPVDPDAPKHESPPKSSVSKFVDLVFDCGRNYQISPAGYVIPIRFEPGLYKELFRWQPHSCDAFVTPVCDPAANQPLYFEYPRKLVDPCEYAQNKLDELAGCGGTAWKDSHFQGDSQQRFCACNDHPPSLL